MVDSWQHCEECMRYSEENEFISEPQRWRYMQKLHLQCQIKRSKIDHPSNAFL
jgi:hypothetical protein